MPLGILFAALLVPSAFGQLFHQNWNGVERRLRRCEDVAVQFSEALARETGVEIYWAGVRREQSVTCDIKISYLATAPLNFLSSSVSESGLTARGYKTAKLCEAALESEAVLLERITGRKPWIRFCYRNERAFTGYPYVAFAETIGASDWKFFVESTAMGGKPLGDWHEIAAEIHKNSEAQGVPMAGVIAEGDVTPSLFSIQARFYSKRKRWITADQFAKGIIGQTCQSQLGYAREFLSRAAVPPLAVFCFEDLGQVYGLSIVAFTNKTFGLEGIGTIEDPKRFPTESECLEKVPATENFYRQNQNHTVLGAFCHATSRGFGIMVFVDVQDVPERLNSHPRPAH